MAEATLSSYTPSMREKIIDLLNGTFYGDNREGRARSERIMNVLDFSPVGVATGAYDAGRALGQGNYVEAGINAAMAGLPGPPVKPKGFRAFHGSPHDFDKFSMEKIGTGEGAKAYGHGLYFAEEEKVAQQYRDQLRWRGSDFHDPQVMAQNALDRLGGDRAAAADDLQRAVDSTVRFYRGKIHPAQAESNKQTEQAIALLRGNEPITGKPKIPGSMYEVQINADPDQFLDWDRPAQGSALDAVQARAEEILGTEGYGGLRNEAKDAILRIRSGNMTGEGAYKTLAMLNANVRPAPGGRYIEPDKTKATEALKAKGLSGIKYLDAGSRTAGDGSRNYVVFDDNIVNIIRKYGVAGAMAMGFGAAISTDPAQAEEISMDRQKQLIDALRKADAAGDVEGARTLANAIRGMRQDSPQMGTAEDMVRSGVAGVGQGTGGMIGTLGDLQSMVSSGAGYLSEKTGLGDPEFMRQSMRRIGGAYYPNTSEVMAPVNDALRPAPNTSQLVTGEQPKGVFEYQPQTTAGEFSRTVGQFAPGMALGPGGVTRNVVSGLGAALASEGAGQAFKGTEYEPYARTIGAVAGGGITALKGEAKVPLASTQALKNEAHAAYKAAEQSGAVLPAADYTQILDRIGQMAVDEGAGRMTPRLRSAMAELVKNEGKDLTVKEVDRMRQNLRFGIDAMKPDEARIIKKMVSEFDNAVEQLAPSPIAEARAKWRVAKKAETLDSLESKAELKAGQYTNSGMENARRTVYRQLASNDRKIKQFSPEEQAAIRKVATGNGLENTARNLGKYAPTGPVPAMTSILAGIGGGSFFGPAGSTVGGLIGTGLAGTGLVAKLVAQGMSKTNARIVDELVRTGKATTQPANKKMLEAIARMLIQGRESQASPQ